SDFHLSRVIDRPPNSPEIGWSGQTKIVCTDGGRIRWLKVVENVSELQRKGHANTLSEFEVFRQCGVEVPIRHAPQIVDATTRCIVTQDAAAEVVVYKRWVAVYVEIEWRDGANTIRSHAAANQMRIGVEVRVDRQCTLKRAAGRARVT